MHLLSLLLPSTYNPDYRHHTFLQRLHIDGPLLGGLLLLVGIGLIILFSAASESYEMITRQSFRLGLAFLILFIFAQISPTAYRRWTPLVFLLSLCSLILVLLVGHIGKGAQRWLDLGILRLQPSELLKLTIPMIAAWCFHDRHLPPNLKEILMVAIIIVAPAFLTALQPDLGTAIILIISGGFVLLLAGLSWRLLAFMLAAVAALTPLIWHFMHDYQRNRVLTFLNPERDPLGAGYHIIQSKIAIGSGGIFGKGWLEGTQSHLNFLPEHATDFIFAVCGEEFGLVGTIVLLFCFLYITARGLYISLNAQDTYTRLLAGSLSLTFCLSALINIGMVIGILPVVGLPLPLISYGGTSLVTVFAGFGILMSIHTHRKLLSG
ncbi:MAG: mrdB [Gammaproteobacteria bacterium]|jgi:rod shape determining protein RodA|nr:mrdB [Gammaproteobacteria bacterium]